MAQDTRLTVHSICCRYALHCSSPWPWRVANRMAQVQIILYDYASLRQKHPPLYTLCRRICSPSSTGQRCMVMIPVNSYDSCSVPLDVQRVLRQCFTWPHTTIHCYPGGHEAARTLRCTQGKDSGLCLEHALGVVCFLYDWGHSSQLCNSKQHFQISPRQQVLCLASLPC